jgi:hypothetical protein
MAKQGWGAYTVAPRSAKMLSVVRFERETPEGRYRYEAPEVVEVSEFASMTCLRSATSVSGILRNGVSRPLIN